MSGAGWNTAKTCNGSKENEIDNQGCLVCFCWIISTKKKREMQIMSGGNEVEKHEGKDNNWKRSHNLVLVFVPASSWRTRRLLPHPSASHSSAPPSQSLSTSTMDYFLHISNTGRHEGPVPFGLLVDNCFNANSLETFKIINK